MVTTPSAKPTETLPKKPEVAVEVPKEQKEAVPEKKVEQEKAPETTSDQAVAPEVAGETPSAAPLPAEPVVVAQKDPELSAIENILSEDLTDIFLALPENQRLTFKQKGEEVAIKVKELVDKGKTTISKVLDLIRDWFRIIPGVNKFFLEQETKKKARKLMEHFEKKKSENQI